jgi:ammonia channel protein AmtB
MSHKRHTFPSFLAVKAMHTNLVARIGFTVVVRTEFQSASYSLLVLQSAGYPRCAPILTFSAWQKITGKAVQKNSLHNVHSTLIPTTILLYNWEAFNQKVSATAGYPHHAACIATTLCLCLSP